MEFCISEDNIFYLREKEILILGSLQKVAIIGFLRSRDELFKCVYSRQLTDKDVCFIEKEGVAKESSLLFGSHGKVHIVLKGDSPQIYTIGIWDILNMIPDCEDKTFEYYSDTLPIVPIGKFSVTQDLIEYKFRKVLHSKIPRLGRKSLRFGFRCWIHGGKQASSSYLKTSRRSLTARNIYAALFI